MGLQKFEIQLNKPYNKFWPGEVVAGRLVIDLDQPKNMRSVEIKFKGKATVHWEETTGMGSDESKTHYTSKEEYIKESIYVLGHKDCESMTLKAGRYQFPFEFRLPNNIPSSFESTDGNVRYKVKAIIDREWKLNHKTSVLLSVEAPYDSSQCKFAKTAIADEAQKSFYCCCCNTGTLSFTIFVPSNQFKIGDAIPANIKINNRSSSNVTKVKFEILQVTKFHATRKTKLQKKVVTKAKEDRCFHKKENIDLFVQVPSVDFFNLEHCSIIDFEYNLGIVIDVSGCHTAMTALYPIVITASSDESAEDMRWIPAQPFSFNEQFSGNTTNAPAPGFSNPTYSQALYNQSN